MGTRGREIVGPNVEKVLTLLNKAFADEWLAYYQYWLGAKVVKGPMKDAAMAELIEHANDELRHADMVAERIIKLGGTPATAPDKWYDLTNCKYNAPDDPNVEVIVDQNIEGEQCAIDVYNEILKKTRDCDAITYDMVLTILQDEEEHEEDLEDLKEDLMLMTKK